MRHSNHIVQEVSFDLQFDKEAAGYQLMDRMSDLFNNRLQAILDEILSNHVDQKANWRLEDLQLDLGTIPYEELEGRLPKIFRQKLIEALALHYQKLSPKAKQALFAPHLTTLEAIMHYLQTGLLPWWYKNKNLSFINTLKNFLQHSPQTFCGRLQATKNKPYVIRRLVSYLSDREFRTIIKTLQPAEAVEILAIAGDIQLTHQKRKIVPTQKDSFKKEIWGFVLHYLLLNRGSFFNTKVYIKSLLQQIANYSSISYIDLIQYLEEIVFQLHVHIQFKSSLPLILGQLIKAEKASKRKEIFWKKWDKELKNSKHSTQLEIIIYYFEKGVLLPLSTVKKQQSLLEIIEQLIDANSTSLKDILSKLIKNKIVRLRLIHQIPNKLLWKLISFVQPKSILAKKKNLKAWKIYFHKKSIRHFDHALIETAFEILAHSKSIKILSPSFLLKLLPRLAQHNGISSTDLKERVLKSKKQHKVVGLTALQKALIATTPHQQTKAFKRTKLEMLGYFLQYGILPMKATQLFPNNPLKNILEDLFQYESLALLLLLRKVGQENIVRKRIAYQFSPAHIHYIIQILEPSEGETIIRYATDLQHLHREAPFLKIPNSIFEKDIYQFILSYLIVERGSAFNKRMFLKGVLQNMAITYRLSYLDLLQLLIDALENFTSNFDFDLKEILQALNQEVKLTKKSNTKSNILIKATYQKIYTDTDLIFFYFEKEHLSEWSKKISQNEWIKFLEQQLQYHPQNFRKCLVRSTNKIKLTTHLQKILQQDTFERMIHLFHTDKEFPILSWSKLIGQQLSKKTKPKRSQKVLQQLLLRYSLAYLIENVTTPFSLETYIQYLAKIMQLHGGLAQEAFFQSLQIDHPVFSKEWSKFLPPTPSYHVEDWPIIKVEQTDFFHFLKTGKWHSFKDKKTNLENIIQLFLRENAEDIRSFVQQNRIHISAIDALVQFLSTPTLIAWLQWLHPTAATHLIKLQSTIVELYLKASENIKQQASANKQSWKSVLFALNNNIPFSLDRVLTETIKTIAVELLKPTEQVEKMLLQKEEQLSNLVKHRLKKRRGSKSNQASTSINSSKSLLSLEYQFEQIWESLATNTISDTRTYQMLVQLLTHPQIQQNKKSLTRLIKHDKLRQILVKDAKTSLIRSLAETLLDSVHFKTLLKHYSLLRKLLKKEPKLISEKAFQLLFWKHTLHFLAVNDKTPRFNEKYFYQSLLEKLSLQQGITFQSLIFQLQHRMNNMGSMVNSEFKTILKQFGAKQPKEEKPYRKLGEKPERTLIGEPIFVNNAGLILTWPFMHQFFKMAKLENMEDEKQAERAVHLLQYLVTKESNTPEFELPLNKLLCGLEVETPITPGIEIEDWEIELCEQMLQSTIQNWEMVKNSSVRNFQVSFLQREGKLSETESYWLLQVEKKAYDLLLKQLPWRLSPVSFSWMDKKIEVEWI